MTVYSYKDKNGQTLFGCRGYLGIDELTGKQVNCNRRGFDTAQEAEKYYLKEKMKLIEEGKKKKANAYTYEEVYEQWLEQYRLTVKDSTLAKTKEIFKLHILPAFGTMIISKIKPYSIQKQVNIWRDQFDTYRRMFGYVNRVFKFAYIHDLIKENPCHKVLIAPPKKDFHTVEQVKYYDKDELKEVLSIIKEREPLKWYAVFRLFAFTGLRRGELLALTWGDIDFNGQTLDVNKSLASRYIDGKREQYVTTPKNRASIRNITLDAETVNVLKQWKVEQAKTLLAFGHNARSPEQLMISQLKTNKHIHLSAPYSALHAMSEKHHFRMIRIHDFRHTHCSLLFEAGVPMKDVKERLGHSKIKTTMDIYTHVTEQSRNESAEKFARYVNF